MAVYFQLGLLRYPLETKSTVGIRLNTFKEKIKSYSKQESISQNTFVLSSGKDMGNVLKICGYTPDMQEFHAEKK